MTVTSTCGTYRSTLAPPPWATTGKADAAVAAVPARKVRRRIPGLLIVVPDGWHLPVFPRSDFPGRAIFPVEPFSQWGVAMRVPTVRAARYSLPAMPESELVAGASTVPL